jgi:hypothetical protein
MTEIFEMDDQLEWVPVSSRGKVIGAIGFVGDKIVVIYSHYANRDFNRDGKVSIGEWATGLLSPIGVDNLAFVEVAQAARIEEGVYLRGDIESIANRMALNFFANAMVDGVFAAWLSRSLKQTSGALAPLLTPNIAKQFMFRKGMEMEVKKIWKQSFQRDLPSGMPTLKSK